jgi:hypothetical protein
MYCWYIAIVAFTPSIIAIPLAGSITVGIVLGVAIILASILLTGIYVMRANAEDDDPTSAIVGSSTCGEESDEEADSLRRARRRFQPSFAVGVRRRPGNDLGDKLERHLHFPGVVIVTLGITYLAAQQTRTTKDFYAAGGGFTGLQTGLAIAGDYMSAASFLSISALVYPSGYYGLIYSIGFLVGWRIIMFMMAEPLRNLGRFRFADVASYRLQATPIRAMAATGTLVVVALSFLVSCSRRSMPPSWSVWRSRSRRVNFPALLVSIMWKGLTTRAAVIGGFVGRISALVLRVVSPAFGGQCSVTRKARPCSPFCRRPPSPCRCYSSAAGCSR